MITRLYKTRLWCFLVHRHTPDLVLIVLLSAPSCRWSDLSDIAPILFSYNSYTKSQHFVWSYLLGTSWWGLIFQQLCRVLSGVSFWEGNFLFQGCFLPLLASFSLATFDFQVPCQSFRNTSIKCFEYHPVSFHSTIMPWNLKHSKGSWI